MKKIFLFATLITGLFSSVAVMAQKKKAIAIAPTPQVSLAKDPIIKEQSFRLLGPFRGGRAAAGVGSYADINTFYMGATGGGVWKTIDAGNNWKNISDGYFGGTIGAIAIAASKVLPRVLRAVRWEKDFFLIYSVSFGLVLAALGTVVFGIPMALAGFVAGLAINQSRDTEEVRKAILPFRDLFAVLFFVVIGTLIEPSQIQSALPFAALILALMILVKTLPTIGLARIGKMKVRPYQLGVGVSQIGEFSFVLGSLAFVQEAITRAQYTGLLLAVVLSITGSTIMVRRPYKQRSI